MNSGTNNLMVQFYNANYSWLLSRLRKKMSCPFDAADLTQDTFIKIIINKNININEIEQPKAFLTTVAHGLMVSHFRKKDIETAFLKSIALLPDEVSGSPESRAIVIQSLTKIDQMLDGLPPRVRRAFLLSQLEGLSHKQIASDMGVSISSVRQYISKALIHCFNTI